MAKKFTWKAWLQPNLLTKDVPNDYTADVSTAGDTKRNEDIARAIKDEGSDLQTETIIDVLNRSDRWKRRYLLEGSSVQDGNTHLSPRIKGSWEGADPRYDSKAHKITLDATLTADLRKTLEDEVGVEVLGKKADGGALIGLVTDVATGKTDGTITPGGDLIITGAKIRVEPLDGSGTGIVFIAADGDESFAARPYTQNDPKKLVCRIPALAAGAYTLNIVTRYSSSNTLLKALRTIVYEQPLTVG
jgi:hypothetical protein